MSTQDNTRNESPETLEERADDKRAEISRTISQLEQKFSPGQMVDQAMDMLRDNGGEMAQNLGRTIKQNPLPLLLTGIGLSWLAASQRRDDSRGARDTYQSGFTPERFGEAYEGDTYGRGFDEAYDQDSERYLNDASREWREPLPGGDALSSGVERQSVVGQSGSVDQTGGIGQSGGIGQTGGVSQSGGGIGRDDRSAISGNSSDDDSLLDKARQAGQSMRDKVGAMGSNDSDQRYQRGGMQSGSSGRDWQGQTNRGMQSMRGSARSMGQDASEFMQDQPLVVGAAGVALGALIGALLPATRVEDRLAGEYSDPLTDKAASAATDAMKQSSQKLDQAIDDAKEAGSEKLAEADEQAQKKQASDNQASSSRDEDSRSTLDSNDAASRSGKAPLKEV